MGNKKMWMFVVAAVMLTLLATSFFFGQKSAEPTMSPQKATERAVQDAETSADAADQAARSARRAADSTADTAQAAEGSAKDASDAAKDSANLSRPNQEMRTGPALSTTPAEPKK